MAENNGVGPHRTANNSTLDGAKDVAMSQCAKYAKY